MGVRWWLVFVRGLLSLSRALCRATGGDLRVQLGRYVCYVWVMVSVDGHL